MTELMKFPSIEQFRHVVKAVNEREPNAVLRFEGTVKLHGTNAGVRITPNNELICQSRNTVIQDGHFGFVDFVKENQDVFDWMNQDFFSSNGGVVFGEWCGPGIQKGVALSQLPTKRFVVFAAAQTEDNWINPTLGAFSDRIHNIRDYGLRKIDIDFSCPEIAQAKMVELTNAVEARCPYAIAWGVDGVGEGIVWRCITPGWESSRYWFKVKGEKHSVTKVHTLASPDVEKVASARMFVTAVTTEARLQQGLDHLREFNLPITTASTGEFIKWVTSDIMKEEADTLEASELTPKDVNGILSKTIREWFFTKTV